jgi:hypothetical protein
MYKFVVKEKNFQLKPFYLNLKRDNERGEYSMENSFSSLLIENMEAGGSEGAIESVLKPLNGIKESKYFYG